MTRYGHTCQATIVVSANDDCCPECGQTFSDLANEATVELHAQQWQTATELCRNDPFVGREIDHYRIERFLGRGGMARVYLARHLELDRDCAIKLLHDGGESNAERVAAFLHEARTAAALVHPHVVTIHTLGCVDGQRFIEMEYVDGNSLAHLVSAGPLAPLEATRIMLQISSALSSAHELGMFHRDIKPGNVMVTSARDAKLADFGLAKRIQLKDASSKDMICGTPHYMAPELFSGRPAGPSSDVYAMGVSYFSLLTGQLPVTAASVNDLIRLHTTETNDTLRALNDGLPANIVRAIASKYGLMIRC
jgi:serine/threonine-protein kinase